MGGKGCAGGGSESIVLGRGVLECTSKVGDCRCPYPELDCAASGRDAKEMDVPNKQIFVVLRIDVCLVVGVFWLSKQIGVGGDGGENLGKRESSQALGKRCKSGLRGWEEGAEIFLNQQAPFSPVPRPPTFRRVRFQSQHWEHVINGGVVQGASAGHGGRWDVPKYHCTFVPSCRKSGVSAPAHMAPRKIHLGGGPLTTLQTL